MSTNVALASLLIGSTDPTHARPFSFHVGDVLNVKSFGAVGDGVTDDTLAIQDCFDAAFGTVASPHVEALQHTNRIVYFPSGKYITTAAINGQDVACGAVIGNGKHATQIINTTVGTDVLFGNPFTFFLIKDLSLISAGGTGTPGDDVGEGNACLNNSRRTGSTYFSAQFIAVNVRFSGADLGVKMGEGFDGNAQTSETLWLSCDFDNCMWGIWGTNSNSLNHVIIGGTISNNEVGIRGDKASFPLIQGVRFFNNSETDMQILNGNNVAVIGCHSTSLNFAVSTAFEYDHNQIIGCYHTGAGHFTRGLGSNIIEGCHATSSRLESFGTPHANTRAFLRGNRFDNAGYLTSQPYGGTTPENY